MGPKRTEKRSARQSQTPYQYDLSLPENWTVNKLKSELNTLGVNYSDNLRKTQLITLYKRAQSQNEIRTRGVNVNDGTAGNQSEHGTAGSETERPITSGRVTAERQMEQPSTSAQNESVLLEAIRDLTSTVKDLKHQINVNNAGGQGRTVPSAAGSALQTMETQISDTGVSYSLQSAYAAYQTGQNNVPSPSIHTQSTSTSAVRTRYGYAADSLPHVNTVPPSIRKAIIEGKDVNLASLLIPYHLNTNYSEDEKKAEKHDSRLSKTLTIGEFISAFGTYKSVMCEVFPQRREELDLYERDIVEMVTRYGGSGFYEYHRLFSLKAAANLRYNNIPVDWSVRDNTLFCNIFANLKPVACYNCASTSHTAAFCPQALDSQGDLSRTSRSYPSSKSDSYGRQRVTYGGQEICNNFNGEKGCNRPRCNNLHVCLVCKKDHPKIRCEDSKNDQSPKVIQKGGKK